MRKIRCQRLAHHSQQWDMCPNEATEFFYQPDTHALVAQCNGHIPPGPKTLQGNTPFEKISQEEFLVAEVMET